MRIGPISSLCLTSGRSWVMDIIMVLPEGSLHVLAPPNVTLRRECCGKVATVRERIWLSKNKGSVYRWS